MAKSSSDSKRTLFQRPDGTPYDFWIQSNFPQMTQDTLKQKIQQYGGRVTNFGEFPEHGFLLLDALDPTPLYEVKTTFHKPVTTSGGMYERTNTIKPNPLRHVLSSGFVAAAIEKGQWNRYDLLRWGFPVSMTQEDRANPKGALERFRREVNLGVDPEMEKGWILATGTVFDSYDPDYRFTEEFKFVDQQINSKGLEKKPKKLRTWLRGRAVAGCRLKWQLKFYLHDDIKNSDQERLITAILENGGATCYDSTQADVILVGCEISEIDDDMDIQDWITRNPRKTVDDDARTLVKFTSWVDRCIEAGDWKVVDPKMDDVAYAYRASSKGRLTAKQKGKGRAILTEANSAGKKRKRSSNENLKEGDELGSPAKKRKYQPGDIIGRSLSNSNVSDSKTRLFASGSTLEHGSGSTVRPKRFFQSIGILDYQPSPLKHDANISSLILGRKSDPKPESKGRDREIYDILAAPAEEDHPSVIIDPHHLSRASAGSVLTVDTATSSKVGNTTTNTATTRTSKSARSVGPSLPSNAKQVPRLSTSTRADTEISGAGRGALDQSLELSPRKPNEGRQSTAHVRTNIDADDLASEVILTSFSGQPKAADYLATRPITLGGNTLTEFEEALVLCWRQMSELDYRYGINIVGDIVTRWPDLEKELRSQAPASRKGKGRVSFRESSGKVVIDLDHDFVLETDYDEGRVAKSQQKEDAVKRPSNLRAYAHNRLDATPESAVSDDGGSSVESEFRLNLHEKSTTVETPRPMMVSGSSILKQPPGHAASGVPPKPSPLGTTKQEKASRIEPEGLNADKDTQEDKRDEAAENSEENEEVAPLPLVKRRSQRKRAGSVISSNGSEIEGTLPRRGRSASAVPSEQSRRATKPEAIPGRRKHAVKSTVGEGPSRKR